MLLNKVDEFGLVEIVFIRKNLNHEKLTYFLLNCQCVKNTVDPIVFFIISFNVFTNPEHRFRISEACRLAGLPNIKLKVPEYRKQLSASRFVICPPGNGVDCHRTWEAFYHKTIPVIEKESYLFSHIELPVLVYDDINEFLSLTDDEKLELYVKINSRFYPAIYCDWWIARIFDKVNKLTSRV